jgi:hypothetical protein
VSVGLGWVALVGCGGRAAWSDVDDGALAGAGGAPTGSAGTGSVAPPEDTLPERGTPEWSWASGREWQVLATPERDPSSIAADERFVYWVSPDVRRRDYQLRAMPLGGGRRVTLYTGNPGLRYLQPVQRDEYVYFEENGRIARVSRTSPGSDLTMVAGENLAGFAIDTGDVLYYVQTPADDPFAGTLRRSFLGLDRDELVAIALPAVQRIALAGDYVYLASERRSCPGEFGVPARATECRGGGIYRIPKNGGSVEQLHQGNAVPDLVVNDRGIYWLDSERERLLFAPLGGAEEELAHIAAIQGFFAQDAGSLYFASEDRVTRLLFDGGLLMDLSQEVDAATGVAVSGEWVYVAEAGPDQIARTPIDPIDVR